MLLYFTYILFILCINLMGEILKGSNVVGFGKIDNYTIFVILRLATSNME